MDARLRELKDSGHAAPLDQPEQIVEAVKGFFLEVEELARDTQNLG